VIEPIAGLFAAVPTPVHDDGRIDDAAFERVVDLVVEAGVSGICIAGATGEYPHFESADRKALIRRAAARLPPGRSLLVGIGAPSMRLAIELGEAAMKAGTRAVLLPMPMFFRYEQQDLKAYCASVSRALRAPCLLYNLPNFTNGLERSTIVNLLRTEAHIVGIKDSSGDATNLSALAGERGSEPWSLLVGDDRLLLAGLRTGWDGAISGVAGFCPELLVAIHRSASSNQMNEAARLQGLLEELTSRLMIFPAPWGIRIGLAARGYPTGPLPLPVTPDRQQQIADFTAWLQEWLVSTGLGVTAVPPAPAGRRRQARPNRSD
jgi:4-hydroxy-tetrahydrodipicolinate synthase